MGVNPGSATHSLLHACVHTRMCTEMHVPLYCPGSYCPGCSGQFLPLCWDAPSSRKRCHPPQAEPAYWGRRRPLSLPLHQRRRSRSLLPLEAVVSPAPREAQALVGAGTMFTEFLHLPASVFFWSLLFMGGSEEPGLVTLDFVLGPGSHGKPRMDRLCLGGHPCLGMLGLRQRCI